MDQYGKDRKIIRLEETQSTNQYIRQLLKEEYLEEGSMVIAEYQTGGRGQMGNTWFSSKGENLLFSFIMYPQNVRANEQFIISRIVSLAVKRTLDRFSSEIRIKWPNDIYWKDQKIAGILIENDLKGSFVTNVVVGIGINVNQPEFPIGIPNPVSIRQITGVVQDKEMILDTFQRELSLVYCDFQHGKIKEIEEAYMRHLYRADGYFAYEDKNGSFMAKIDDVLPSGHLVLKAIDNEERRIYAFKEVEFDLTI